MPDTTMVSKQGPKLEGVPPLLLAALVVAAAVMFSVSIYTPISTGMSSTRREDAGKSAFDKAPTMSELKLMSCQDRQGVVTKVQVIKECVEHNLCSKLQSRFGLASADITDFVRQNPEYCCQAVFQKWYVRGSNPKDAYPISWASVVKVLKEEGLQGVATDLWSILARRNNDDNTMHLQ